MQSCYFANLNLLLYCRSRWRRRCLGSLTFTSYRRKRRTFIFMPLLKIILSCVTSVVNLYVMVNTEQTFFNANDAVWPALSSLTGILLRWIVLTWIGWNWPRGSGPSNKVSFSRIVPRRHVPDTTVPTPWKLQKQPFWLIPLALSLKQLKCHELRCFGELAHIKEWQSYFERWPFTNLNFRLFYDGR